MTFILIIVLMLSQVTHAEVILDGSLGPKTTLLGPDYDIAAELGQQHGNNLFHSFQTFNLQSHESATFSGHESIGNVITRVTGGQPSHIDGMLRLTLPHADFYLLNPAGLLFGQHAVLNMNGSFYASTADSLRLGAQGQFNARLPKQSLLTVAQPTAFGFLTENPASITFKDSTLTVNPGKNLAFIGGDLIIDNEQLGRHFDFRPHQGRPAKPMADSVNDLWVDSGYLYFASLAAAGEIGLSKHGFILDSEMAGGHITAHNALISARGEGGGHIFIRGGALEFTHSVIENGVENQQVQGKISIQADNVTLRQGSVITSTTEGVGNGGHIQIQVNGHLRLTGEAQPLANNTVYSSGSTQASGRAGTIEIKANQVHLEGGAQIASGSYGCRQSSHHDCGGYPKH